MHNEEGAVEPLLHLNYVIKFTMELEKDGSLPFLDTKLTLREDGTLSVSFQKTDAHRQVPALQPPPPSKEEKKQALAVIPYVSGVCEWIRKSYEKFNLKVVFKSGAMLCSLLTRVKDPLKEKLVSVVYQIPCQCGKVYVGETKRYLETQVKEHREACDKGDTWSLLLLSISGTSSIR